MDPSRVDLQGRIYGTERRAGLKRTRMAPQNLAASAKCIALHGVKIEGPGNRVLGFLEPLWVRVQVHSHRGIRLCEQSPRVGEVRIEIGYAAKELNGRSDVEFVYVLNTIDCSKVEF